jgi:hypothetical protein
VGIRRNHEPPSHRLLARLRRAGLDLSDGAAIRRSYAGRHQLAAGAWRWWIEVTEDGRIRPLDIGSHHTVAELLRCPRIVAVRDAQMGISIELVSEEVAGEGDCCEDVRNIVGQRPINKVFRLSP